MEFNEDFLQTVWKYQYFNKEGLVTSDGTPIEVRKIGYHNFHEGPDFLEALVRIGKLDHIGHVEVHKKASDWKNHEHDVDGRYNSVILHVVWEEDKPIRRQDGTAIPTLELKGKILLDVLRNYERLLTSNSEILCGDGLNKVPEIIRFSMLEKTLLERLEIKSQRLLNILEETNNDWEESTYRWLFQSFGFKTNADPMLKLAEKIPLRTLLKQSKQPLAIEAMMLGQAGLIPDNPVDEYGKFLKNEYLFYQKKYGWNDSFMRNEWKLMGVRPQNFPPIRIAQLAQIISKTPNLFSAIIEHTGELTQFKNIFDITISDYWQYHYQIGAASKIRLNKSLSRNTLSLLTINFILPLWYTYGKYLQEPSWKERCFDVLQHLSAEENNIIRKFATHNWLAENAFDTQGMIGLFNEYCSQKKCLDCKIGQNLLKPDKK